MSLNHFRKCKIPRDLFVCVFKRWSISAIQLRTGRVLSIILFYHGHILLICINQWFCDMIGWSNIIKHLLHDNFLFVFVYSPLRFHLHNQLYSLVLGYCRNDQDWSFSANRTFANFKLDIIGAPFISRPLEKLPHVNYFCAAWGLQDRK